MLDWSDGTYERTAAALAEVSQALTSELEPGLQVIDVGCGTGNAALAAARRGCRVTGVDPAARLLEVARAQAEREALPAQWLLGEGGALPVPTASQDVALAVFSIIFAPDPERCIAELRRVVRPGGRVHMTAWLAEGPIRQASDLMFGIARQVLPPAPPSPSPTRWGDADTLRALWSGADVVLTRALLRFRAASAEAWFDEQQQHHPAWRAMYRDLQPYDGAWARVREASVELLAQANVSAEGWAVDSPYWRVDVRLPG